MTNKEIYTLITVYLSINLLLVFAFNSIIFNETFYFNLLINQFEVDDIQKFLIANRKVALLSYFFIPLIILIRIVSVAGAFKIYTELKHKNFHFRSILEISLIAEVVFVFQVVLKFAFILFYGTTIENVKTMSVIFSLNQIIESKPDYLNYLFSCINIFDLSYFLSLAFAYSSKFKSGLSKAFEVTTFSYLPLLLLWIIIITFITM